MSSIEKTVKSQFAKIFAESDWPLFKKMAESNLEEAAALRRSNMRIDQDLQLLARNSRKRLLIGVGVELLLKAIYLKQGYAINKAPRDSSVRFPFLAKDVATVQLMADQTFMLNDLVENLPKVLQLQAKSETIRGLKIAKVFRNKEGHAVTSAHTFVASNYQEIAFALSALFRDAFGETLSVKFAMAPNEKAIWRLVAPPRRGKAEPRRNFIGRSTRHGA